MKVVLKDPSSLEEFSESVLVRLEETALRLEQLHSERAQIQNNILDAQRTLEMHEGDVYWEMRREAEEGEKFKDPVSGRSNQTYRGKVRDKRLAATASYNDAEQSLHQLELRRNEIDGWIAGKTRRLQALRAEAELLSRFA